MSNIIYRTYSHFKEYPQLFTAIILLLLFSELGETLHRTEGRFHFRRLLYFLIPTIIFFYYWIKGKYKSIRPISHTVLEQVFGPFICIVSCYFLYKLFKIPLIIYQQNPSLYSVISFSYLGLILLNILSLVRRNFSFIYFSIVFLFLLKIATLIISPSPIIDVFTSNTDAVKYFLQGINPYTGSYTDIYSGRYDYTPGYVYWPFNLYLQSISYLLTKDIRSIFIVCDLLTLFGLSRILKNSSIPSLLQGQLLLLWFLLPIHNFVLEQSWIDPILVTLSIWCFYFQRKNKTIYVGICLGLMCATKQYIIIFAIILGLYYFIKSGAKEFIKLVLVTIATFSITVGPFLIANFEAFLQMTVRVPLLQKFRPDSYSILAAYHFLTKNNPVNFWYLPLSLFSLGIGVYSLIKYRNSGVISLYLAMFITYLLTFMLGKQAFCNYYYFLAIFLYFSMIETLELLAICSKKVDPS